VRSSRSASRRSETAAARCGAKVASPGTPVQEIVIDGKQGLLFDLFAQEQLLDAIDRQLDERDAAVRMGERARQRAPALAAANTKVTITVA
jgi:hypothetical protein